MELVRYQRDQAASCSGQHTAYREIWGLLWSLIQLSCPQDVYKELRENRVCFIRINSSDVLAPKFYQVSEFMRDEDLGGLT